MTVEALNYQKFIVNSVFWSGYPMCPEKVNEALELRQAHLAQNGLVSVFERALILAAIGNTASSRAKFAEKLNREIDRLISEANEDIEAHIESFVTSLGLDPDQVADAPHLLLGGEL